ncbi:hypothetical protein ACUNWD_00900 [Sunxiuqinia sp. A32]|uniref:hypothetical protein n=1 Tax=Sunxiuqinia sp. A32 TaxID=3461496 RepID=UPI004046707A
MFAQTNEDDDFIFQGYILSEDSIPMENVYIINYRNTKIVATDESGYFKTWVKEGDSLMVNHIALSPKILHGNNRPASDNINYITYNSYMIGNVSSNDFKKELELFDLNMKQIKDELKIPEPKMRGLDSLNANRYDNEPISPGLDLRILLELLKKKKK